MEMQLDFYIVLFVILFEKNKSFNKQMLVEVKIGALIMDPNSNTPIVVLKSIKTDTILPIWVGAFEANAIALEIEKITPQRPMTHDLLRNLIIESGLIVNRIIINELKDNTFYALIELFNNLENPINLDARPSDAIALALRLDCPIFVDQKVIDISSSTTPSTANDFEEPELSNEEWPDLIS
ncbi:MAG: bifunctional nuclease family protein [Pyrinomonadaceae bacterium]